MDKQIYIECARAMLNRLHNEINGGIKYEISIQRLTLLYLRLLSRSSISTMASITSRTL